MKLDDALNLMRMGALDGKLDERVKISVNRDALETVLNAYDSRERSIDSLEKQRGEMRDELFKLRTRLAIFENQKVLDERNQRCSRDAEALAELRREKLGHPADGM